MEIIMNSVVIFLLILTIFFCWRLNAKIADLKGSRKDLSQLVSTFDNAIIKTHKSIADLKSMSQTSAQELQVYVDKARELLSDLSFMTDTASKLADRLEGSIVQARKESVKTSQILDSGNIVDMISNLPNNKSSNSNTRSELMKTINKLKSNV